MKRLLYIPWCFLVLFSCKKDSIDIPAQIDALVGTWKLTSIEQFNIDKTSSWQNVFNANPSYLTFRFDGVVIDSTGKAACCGPGSFVIKGKSYEIKPQLAAPDAIHCNSIVCALCPTWGIDLKENELIISACTAYRTKYIRQ